MNDAADEPLVVDGCKIEFRCAGWTYPTDQSRDRWCVVLRDGDEPTLAWLEDDGGISIHDDCQYYPGGCYTVTGAQIAKLKELSAE